MTGYSNINTYSLLSIFTFFLCHSFGSLPTLLKIALQKPAVTVTPLPYPPALPSPPPHYPPPLPSPPPHSPYPLGLSTQQWYYPHPTHSTPAASDFNRWSLWWGEGGGGGKGVGEQEERGGGRMWHRNSQIHRHAVHYKKFGKMQVDEEHVELEHL